MNYVRRCWLFMFIVFLSFMSYAHVRAYDVPRLEQNQAFTRSDGTADDPILPVGDASQPSATTTVIGMATVRVFTSERADASAPFRARTQHTATRLTNGSVLFVGGRDQDKFPLGTDVYIASSGNFAETGKIKQGRADHAAVRLQDGRVLVVGGYVVTFRNGQRISTSLASAELYDPATSTWTTTGSMATARTGLAITLLNNGQVLVTGGYNGSAVVASAELYSPTTGTWSPTGMMTRTRNEHTATLLQDGTVLVAGGGDTLRGGFSSSAELYHPTTGTFTAVGSMLVTPAFHTAMRLNNGKVLIAGGSKRTTQLYDPATRTFAVTGDMNTAQARHAANLLPDGKVLVTGGPGSGTLYATNTAELYDPATGVWTLTGRMRAPHADHTATLLTDGSVIVYGGRRPERLPVDAAITYPERYNPATNSFESTNVGGYGRPALLPDGRILLAGAGTFYDPATMRHSTAPSPQYIRDAPLVSLQDGRVMLVGGFVGYSASTPTTSVELYNPKFDRWRQTGRIMQGRAEHTATLLLNGKVLVVGGIAQRGGSALSSAEVYDPTTDKWTTTGSMRQGRINHTATLLKDGTVLVTGGIDNVAGPFASAERYNPATGVWTPTQAMQVGRTWHAAALLPSGKVLIAGGDLYDTDSTSAELFDPVSNRFTPTGYMIQQRYGFSMTTLPDGIVLVAGSRGSSPDDPAYVDVEYYDPANGTFSAAGRLSDPCYCMYPQLLPDGRVYFAYENLIGKLTITKRFMGSLTVPSAWSTTATPTVTLSDSISGATLDAASLNDGPWITVRPNTETVATLPALTDGRNQSVMLRLRDRSGTIRTVVTTTIDVDTVAPSSTMTALPPTSSPMLTLQWTGQDATSGIAGYDVHVREGADGIWTPILRNTSLVETTYTGTPGHTYYFRVRGRDVAGNVEALPAYYDTMTWISP